MSTPNQVNELLINYPEPVQVLAEETRELLLKLLPEVQETVDLPAKLLAYGYGPRYTDSICTIILSKKGIKLGFYKGASLPDPDSLLAGTGKVHKYVQINDVHDVQRPAVTQLILDAYAAFLERR